MGKRSRSIVLQMCQRAPPNCKGVFTISSVGVDIPAPPVKRSFGNVGWAPGFSPNRSHLAKLGAEVPLRTKAAEHYVFERCPIRRWIKFVGRHVDVAKTGVSHLGQSPSVRRRTFSGPLLANFQGKGRLLIAPHPIQGCISTREIPRL